MDQLIDSIEAHYAYQETKRFVLTAEEVVPEASLFEMPAVTSVRRCVPCCSCLSSRTRRAAANLLLCGLLSPLRAVYGAGLSHG